MLNEAVGTRRLDGLFVKTLGVDLATLQACNLCADQCGSVLDVLRAILRVDLKLSVVGDHSLQMRHALVSGCGAAAGGPGQGAVEMMFRRFFERRHECPWQPPRPRRRIEGRSIVAGEEAGLELS